MTRRTQKISAKRSAANTVVYKAAAAAYRAARKMERSDPAKAKALYAKAERLLVRADKAGRLDGPVGRLPNPYPSAFIARDSSRTCYHCGKQIRKGTVLVAGPNRLPYHQKCYRQAEKDAALELQRKAKPNPRGGPRVVHNRLLGGWFVVVGPHQTPLNGRFDSKVEAQAWLRRRQANPFGHTPEEWDDIEAEGMELGTQAARAIGRSEREHRARVKRYHVTWYSPLRGKRTGFVQTIEAHTANDAKRQAKAMVTNDPKAGNFVAKEVARNPKGKPKAQSFKVNSVVNLTMRYGNLFTYDNPYLVVERSGQRLRIASLDGDSSGWVDPEYLQKTAGGKSIYDNPGLIDLAANLQAADFLSGAPGGKRKRNPSLRDLSETFQGKASGAVSEYKAANSAPSNLARIGRLVFIKLADSRKQTRVPGVMVAVDQKGRLWIVGNRTPIFKQKAKPGEMLDYGEIERFCYETTKAHIEPGKLIEYDHPFEAPRPRLLIDAEGMPIIRGGGYAIKAEGVTG